MMCSSSRARCALLAITKMRIDSAGDTERPETVSIRSSLAILRVWCTTTISQAQFAGQLGKAGEPLVVDSYSCLLPVGFRTFASTSMTTRWVSHRGA